MNRYYAVLFFFLCFLLTIWNELCAETISSTFASFSNVQYIRNFDGDSITFDIPEAPSIVGNDMVVRLRGIDTPELKKSKCPTEIKIALQAKNRVHSLLQNAKVINLHRTGRGKYFRILADVEFDGVDLATLLLEEELAVKYFGGTRNHDWCAGSYSMPVPVKRGPSTLPPLVDGIYVWPPPPKQELTDNAGKQ